VATYYFPHILKESKTIGILEERFNNDGYAFWFKLLEILSLCEDHIFDTNTKENRHLLFKKTRVNRELAGKIINCLCELDAIDNNLWEKERKIYVKNLEGSVRKLLAKQTVIKETNLIDDGKINYAMYVRYTPDEYKKLIELTDYGEPFAKRCIFVLNAYKGQSKKNQKKYDSDYLATLNWVVDKVKKEFKDNPPNNSNKYKKLT
jgi:hypothetical protein